MNAQNKIKIFLVDDDEMFVECLKNSLKGKRKEIRSFRSGDECLKSLSDDPRIVVLDYELNNSKNGVQILNQIKQTNPDTQVIMLSGVDNKNIMDDSMKYGAYDYIEKGESALFKLKKEVDYICEEIESTDEIRMENRKMLWINAAIILVIMTIFILTHIK